jgi:hypothetical protein
VLFLGAARGQHLLGVLAVQAGEQVAGADEAAEQAKAVEAAREARDATAPAQVGTLLVGAGGVIEVAAQEPVVLGAQHAVAEDAHRASLTVTAE